MQEELGELSHAFLKKHQRIRMDEDQDAAMVDAIGDFVIYLAGFCNAAHLDLASSVEATWIEVKKRDWVKYPEKGVPNASANPTP
jgi:NTP pyrophosphatase (non-canonical NTP hydrolase)